MSEIKDATIEDVLDKMKKNNRKSDLKLIKRAYEFAKAQHRRSIKKVW